MDVTLEQLVARSRRNFRTVEDMVASVIRNAIGAGIFKPGERLPQDRLASLLQVSRMPIRAALRQLESEGLLELHPHRGATVRSLSEQEIADLYEMRILIETFALRKTAAAIDDASLAELDDLATLLERSASPEEWLERRQIFYRRLYSIGNTPRVVRTIMQFRSEVSRYTVDLRNLRSETHRELLDQLRLGDPDLAAVWLEGHLRQVARALRRQIASRTEE